MTALRKRMSEDLLFAGYANQDLRVTKDLLGQSSIVTTDIYTHVTGKITTRLQVHLNGMMACLQP
jgi:site-specific recombinase XerD